MTREQAVKWLKDLMRDVPMPQYEDALDMAIQALTQEPKWIPVSERMPSVEEQYNEFLVIDDTGRMSVQEFYLTLYDHQPFFSGCLNVVAWMPLPEPYKPQERSEENERII